LGGERISLASVINYTVYSYIFALLLGVPTFIVLKKFEMVASHHFLFAGLILSLAPCAFIYFSNVIETLIYLFDSNNLWCNLYGFRIIQ